MTSFALGKRGVKRPAPPAAARAGKRAPREDENSDRHNDSDDASLSNDDTETTPAPQSSPTPPPPALAGMAADPARAWSLIRSRTPAALPLPPSIIDILTNTFGFHTATPVQFQTIPYFLSNCDPIVQATTGSGKSLAFLVPVLTMLMRRHTPLAKHEVGAIILSPTHEIAQQIESVAHTLLDSDKLPIRLSLLSLIGGVRDHDSDLLQYQSHGGNIIVATPGRLEALLKSHRLNTKSLTVLVLDEADILLSAGFETSMNFILSMLPKQRRTGLFSATQTIDANQIRRVGMQSPTQLEVKITFNKSVTSGDGTVSTALLPSTLSTPATLRNYYVELPVRDKVSYLLTFLSRNMQSKIILFYMTCACVDYFTPILSEHELTSSITFIPLHGKLTSKKRETNLRQFVDIGSSVVLVASDVAARGIDISDVDYIVQFDAPNKPDFFTHRVGRTARMGRKGSALLLISPHEEVYPVFLAKQGAPIEIYTDTHAGITDTDTDSASVSKWLMDRCLSDRAVFEQCQSALVSFIRGYKEHELKFIFEFHKLPFADLAFGYGCLMFPLMADLKHYKIQYNCGFKFDANEIQYRDTKKERQRLASEEAKRAKREQEKAERVTQQRQRAEAKGTAKQQLQAKRELKRKPHVAMRAEWDELAKDNRAIKAQKKGKLSKREMDAILFNKGDGGSDSDDSDDDSD